jgi:ABC-type multidrug transport system permease subunit
MKLLRGLADAGKTILITIHQPSLDVFRLMDDVIVLWKNPTMQEPGRLVYFGPAYPRSIEFLNEEVRAEGREVSPDFLMRQLPKEKQAGDTRPWAQKYAASQEKKEYVDDRAGQLRGVASAPVASRLNRRLGLGQWWTFARRAFAVKRRDRRSTLILLSQAPIIAALIAVVFGELGAKSTQPGRVVPTTLFLLVVAALWFGCSNSAREIVAEWAIYHRERMVNLKIPSYVMSKFTVLGMLCVLQCAMLLMLVYPLCELKASLIPMFMVLCLAALTGLGLGLALSAVSRTSEMAVSLVPLILLPMVILGGLMQPRPNMKPLVKAVTAFVPSRWAFESLLVLESNARDRDRETARDREEPEEQSQATSRGTRRRLPSLEDMQLAGDIAEPYFPQKGRSTAAGSTSVLVFMLTFLMSATLLTLKARDVH